MKHDTASYLTRMLLRLSFAAMILITTGGTAQASELKQEVSLASKVEHNSAKIGKTTEVIDHWLIDAEKPTFLDEALWNVEGLHQKRLSGAEGTLSVFSRGMRSTDSVLAFDGVQFKDTSDPQGSSAPMLQDMILTPYDQVEVVKGSSSSINGSTSQGAIINITRPYTCCVPQVSYTQEVGSLRHYLEEVSAGSRFYRIDAIRLDTDRYNNSTFSGSFKAGNDKLSIEPFFYHIESSAQLHDVPLISGGIQLKDSHNVLNRRDNDLGLYGEKAEFNITDNVTLHNMVSFTDTDRRFVFGSFGSDGSYLGQDWTVDNYITVDHSDILTSAVGWKYETEHLGITQVGVSKDRRANQQSSDFYGEEKIQLGKLYILASARTNNQHGSKDALTYDLSGTVPVDKWQLSSHFGTGFRNPSLYERYGAFLTTFGIFDIGNSHLSPEHSYTWDGTVKFDDHVNTISITPFITDISNPIVFESAIYTNSHTDRKSHGVEGYYERTLFKNTSYRLNYTYTDGTGLIDIPKHEIGNSIIFCQGKWTANARIAYVSQKKNIVFNEDTFVSKVVNENGGIVVGGTVNYAITKNVQLFARVNNLLDRTYTDGAYKKNGVEAYAGCKLAF